ncbi:MAG TPA: hypothetical protein VK663_10840 [Burkholderiales bacterium]|nr:hypothetical protein [Burkholderiales bacterium]
MAGSPTQRSLKHLRELGYLAAVTEHWNPFAHIRQDLFGIVDILAVGNGETIAVQCTSDSNLANRVTKIADSDATPKLRDAGWKILAHGWKKKGARWVLREVDCS